MKNNNCSSKLPKYNEGCGGPFNQIISLKIIGAAYVEGRLNASVIKVTESGEELPIELMDIEHFQEETKKALIETFITKP